MSAERQWGTLEVMGLMKKEPTTEVGDGRIMMTVTASPKPPPPKAPTYARGPSGGSQNLLDGKENEGDPKGKDSKGDYKGKGPEGNRKGEFQMVSQRKRSQMEREKRREMCRTGRRGGWNRTE